MSKRDVLHYELTGYGTEWIPEGEIGQALRRWDRGQRDKKSVVVRTSDGTMTRVTFEENKS